MKTLNRVLIVVFAISLIANISCSGNDKKRDAAKEFRARSIRGLEAITPRLINEFNAEIEKYLELEDDSAKVAEAATQRKNLEIRVEAYYHGLKEAVKKGNDEQKELALICFGFLTDPSIMMETVPILIAHLKKDVDEDFRYRALLGLSLLRESLRTYPDRDNLLYSIALNLRDEKSDLIREYAVEALGYALKPGEKPDLVDELIFRLSDEPEDDVKIWVVDALANIGDAKGLQAIAAQAIDSDSLAVRLEAVVALGESQKPDFIPALIKRLSDSEAAVRRQAIMMLKGFRRFEDKRETIALAIEKLLNDSDYRVRQWAALALGDLGVVDVVPRLIAKLGDRQIRVQLAAVQALGKLRDQQAIQPLINTMASRD